MFMLKKLVLASVVCGSFACMDVEGPATSSVPPEHVLANFHINTNAVIMKVGDTLQLTAIPMAMDSSLIDPIEGDGVVWRSVSPADVEVDSQGRVYGKRVIALPVNIIATYKHRLTTKADTIPVYVTAEKYAATEVRLVALDSLRVGARATGVAPRIRIDVYHGDLLAIKGARLHIESSSIGIALAYAARLGPDGEDVYTVTNSKSHIGKFVVKASGNLYGTEIADSLIFNGIYQALTNFAIGQPSENAPPQFSVNPFETETRFLVQPCGLVLIASVGLTQPVDLIFSDSLEDSSSCYDDGSFPLGSVTIGGNITNIVGAGAKYNMRKSTGSGKIIVRIRNSVTKELYPGEMHYYIMRPES